jgi:aminoglycoside 2'-N-acetyltransferase I
MRGVVAATTRATTQGRPYEAIGRLADGLGRPRIAGVITIEVVACDDLGSVERREIIDLCALAYDEDFDRLFELLPGSCHVLIRDDGVLVSHACWVTRWLQPAGLPMLRAAYIEAVATHPQRQREGLGGRAMERVAAEIGGYDLGALSPALQGFYERLGWEHWRGPTAIRRAEGLLPTPDEEIMILRTVRTPSLDLDAPITAEWREGEVW